MIRRGRDRQPDRFLATILFTDIVGSTDLAVELGDRDWRRVLASHNATIRAVLRRFGGREIDTAGDGFFCAFDQPAQAVRAADAILTGTAKQGLKLRAGLHTGECERIGAKIGGVAVHIAARVMAAAQPTEILVSSTVRDLVPGSGLEFADRGTRELKGVPGEWHLYSLVRPEPDATAADPRTALAAEAEPRPRSSRPALIVAAFALAALIVVGGAWAIANLGGSGPAAPFVLGPNTVVEIDTASGAVVAVHTVAQGPVAIAVDSAARHVWVASLDVGIVSDWAIDSAAQVRTTGRAGRPTALAIGGGSIWVVDDLDKTITLLDLASGEAQGTIENVVARNIVFGFGSAWASDDLSDRVLRLDQQSGSVAQTTDLDAGAYPFGLAVGQDALWVGNRGTTTLARLDPATAAVTDGAVALRAVPEAMAAGTDVIWIAGTESDSVLRLDPRTRSVTKTIAVGDQPISIAADGDTVWVGCAGAQEVLHLSLDGEQLAAIPVHGIPTSIAVSGGRVYVTVRAQ